jgi:hypothetical protein
LWIAGGDASDVEIYDSHEEGTSMSILNPKTIWRRPLDPGEMLREDFLPDFGLTVTGIAEAAVVSRKWIN